MDPDPDNFPPAMLAHADQLAAGQRQEGPALLASVEGALAEPLDDGELAAGFFSAEQV